MRIVGQIKNGIKKICIYFEDKKRQKKAKKDLQTWRANLLVCLASASEKEKKNIMEGIREIDQILH